MSFTLTSSQRTRRALNTSTYDTLTHIWRSLWVISQSLVLNDKFINIVSISSIEFVSLTKRSYNKTFTHLATAIDQLECLLVNDLGVTAALWKTSRCERTLGSEIGCIIKHQFRNMRSRVRCYYGHRCEGLPIKPRLMGLTCCQDSRGERGRPLPHGTPYSGSYKMLQHLSCENNSLNNLHKIDIRWWLLKWRV